MNHDFLDSLADSTPTPGGGSAAAYAAAMAAALVVMVAKLTLNKEKNRSIQDNLSGVIQKIEDLRLLLAKYVEMDAQAYNQLISVRRQFKQTTAEMAASKEAVRKAAFYTAEVPLQMSRAALQVMAEAVQLVSSASVNAMGDAACAVSLCRAAITASCNNVKLNLLPFFENGDAQKMISEMVEISRQSEIFHEQTQSILKERGGI